MEYEHIGYYNGIDAVMLYGLEPEEIVNKVNGGIGAFYRCSGDDETLDPDATHKECKLTMDGEYAVTYDVSNIAQHTPLDLLRDEEICDEFLDVWKKPKC